MFNGSFSPRHSEINDIFTPPLLWWESWSLADWDLWQKQCGFPHNQHPSNLCYCTFMRVVLWVHQWEGPPQSMMPPAKWTLPSTFIWKTWDLHSLQLLTMQYVLHVPSCNTEDKLCIYWGAKIPCVSPASKAWGPQAAHHSKHCRW